MMRPLDIDWQGRMSSDVTFRMSVLQSRAERVVIQLFPRVDARFNEWRVYIFTQCSGSELVLELGFNTTASRNRLTCTHLDQFIPYPTGADSYLEAESHLGYTPPTIRRILEIGAYFDRSLSLAPELSTREVQSRWSSWVLQFVMEVVECEALFVSCSEFHRLAQRIDWNKGDEQEDHGVFFCEWELVDCN